MQLLEEMRQFLELPPKNIKVDDLVEMGVVTKILLLFSILISAFTEPIINIQVLAMNWQIYHEFQKRQQNFIDTSTYNILVDLEGLYDPELGVFDHTMKIKDITHALWCNLYSRPELVGHYYEDTSFRFHIPESLIMTRGVYRLLKLEYDHYSDSSHSYFPPRAQHFYQSCKYLQMHFPAILG